MSKLFKLRLSFILLIVGIGLIPTAFLAKGYFQDQVPANASETLLVLKNEGISLLRKFAEDPEIKRFLQEYDETVKELEDMQEKNMG